MANRAERIYHRAASQCGRVLRAEVDGVRVDADGADLCRPGVPVCGDLSGYTAEGQVSGVRS